MKDVGMIGLDLANNVFQADGIGGSGETAFRRHPRRGRVWPSFKNFPPCLVGREPCATWRNWSREITAPGHVVPMMPARYAKP